MCARKGLAVLGLCYGDEGKGSTVEFLSRIYKADVIRFEGGSQAAHHVVLPNGDWHCFSQIGSGALNGRSSYLYKDMIVDPNALLIEYKVLASKFLFGGPEGPFIHPECRIVTKYHKLVGRARAVALGRSTTGMGVGMVAHGYAWAEIKFQDLLNYGKELEHKLEVLREWSIHKINTYIRDCPLHESRLREILQIAKQETVENAGMDIREFLSNKGVAWKEWDLSGLGSRVILEGSQGALLDYDKGFYPHVSPVHSQLRYSMLEDLGIKHVTTIGVMRSYMTRHGRGVLVTEDKSLDVLPELHNIVEDPYRQGKFRRGWLDLVAVRYGIDICESIDGLFITNLDKTDALPEIAICTGYGCHYHDHVYDRLPAFPKSTVERERLTQTLLEIPYIDYKTVKHSIELPDFIEDELQLPVFGISTGPTWTHKYLRESFTGVE